MVPAMHATTASQMLFIRAPYRNTTPTPRMASRINSCTATAAVLPRNTPAGSRPESRRPSRAPSTDSTDTERWMASTVENRMATQNRPGAALAMGERSGPSAKANRTRAMTPKGATWLRATRDGNRPVSQRLDQVGLMGGDDHGGSARRRLGDQLAQQGAGRRVQTGVGLIEQPQLG